MSLNLLNEFYYIRIQIIKKPITMRIKILLSLFVAFGFFACNNTNKKAEEIKTYDVAQLLEVIDTNIEKELTVTGTVNHVCSHSGRRAFLIDETGENSIRIEAGGEIESFGKDLVGSTLKVKIIAKEDRLTTAEIDEWETEVLEKHPEDVEADGETCSAEMSNIKQMREWMKEHGKDYYAIYYAEGISYEVVE